ncbi:MAG: lipopolysaccharide assembly protein LapA domain-containing protein [Xanthomonadales bacterium]|nr:lipopolysaccharide assembly protein LapA domain-containing protein [Xanthomonadales bacterium]
MFRWLLILFVLAAAVAGLVIGVLNAETVSLELLVIELSLPLGALVLLALALGLVLGLALSWLLFFLPGRLRRASRSRQRHKGTDLADRPNG